MHYSVPAVIAMLVNAIYNVVDRMFIGKLTGENALAGLTITFPIMMIIFAFSGLIAAGGASLVSIRLGERDTRGAGHVFGNTITYGIIVTGLIISIILVNLDGWLVIFGSEPDTHAYARDYLLIILSGFIFQMMSFIFSNFIRTEGKPYMSMFVMLFSASSNIVLDYILIARFNMGVQGAALGTIISQFLGMLIYLRYYLRGKSSIRVKLRDFLPDLRLGLNILTIGFTTFVSTIGTSVAMTFFNRQLLSYGGTAGITSMGAINSLYTFFVMPIIGITQGMQPIIGYNHGAGNRKRVYAALKLALLIGTVFSTVVFLTLMLFAESFVKIFLEDGSSTIPMAAHGLRVFIIMLPVLSINFMGTAFFQSIARGKISAVLGSLRQFIILLPLLLTMPNFWGLNGVWAAAPVADGLAVLLTGAAVLIYYRSERSCGWPAWSDDNSREHCLKQAELPNPIQPEIEIDVV
jgi:putative MATE family efflux protein